MKSNIFLKKPEVIILKAICILMLCLAAGACSVPDTDVDGCQNVDEKLTEGYGDADWEIVHTFENRNVKGERCFTLNYDSKGVSSLSLLVLDYGIGSDSSFQVEVRGGQRVLAIYEEDGGYEIENFDRGMILLRTDFAGASEFIVNFAVVYTDPDPTNANPIIFPDAKPFRTILVQLAPSATN